VKTAAADVGVGVVEVATEASSPANRNRRKPVFSQPKRMTARRRKVTTKKTTIMSKAGTPKVGTSKAITPNMGSSRKALHSMAKVVSASAAAAVAEVAEAVSAKAARTMSVRVTGSKAFRSMQACRTAM
jgi:hypothetical protein